MEKRLFLIDGHALIFKMYYAFLRRPMINSKGADMSILFGFTKYILELIERERPTHLAVAFDPPGKTFRHQLFPEYKGTREETPQLVIDSLEPLTGLCRAMNIPVLMVPGYEADDVIGTISKQEEKNGFTVYMVTPDKDYGQLISEHIIQLKPGKGGGSDELVDMKAVCEKYGISSPLQVIDMLTICGDSSDNVPGVKGIGEVGAGKLISKYGSVENIYGHLDELTAKQREAFESAREYIGMSRTLVTIRTDVPVEYRQEDAAVDMKYNPEIADLFEKYEFNSLTRYISHIPAVEKERPETMDIIKAGPEEIAEIAARTGKCGIVTECKGDSIFSPVSKVTIGAADGQRLYSCEGDAVMFKDMLENGSISKCGYDLKFQMNVLANAGISINGKLEDIELMHYLVNSEKSHKIGVLAKSYLDITLPEDSGQTSVRSLFDSDDDAPDTAPKSAESVVVLLLADKINAEMESLGVTSLYDTMEEPLTRVLSRMEREGIRMDLEQLRLFASELRKELVERQQRIREMAGEPELNISSPKQIGHVLFDKMALDPKAKAKTGRIKAYSTDEETLMALADRHPIINEILEFRAVKKLLSTYIEPFPNYVYPSTGKIHTTFNQALTATGRLSSSKPNLQNIPIRTERGKEIRKAFVPSRPEGLILSADYSQIELRIMAHLSCDTHLTDAFRHNMDVHAMTAAKIFGIGIGDVTPDQRRIAKTANFGIMYGISAFGLSQRLGISRAEAKKIIDDYFDNFPAISSFINDSIISAREYGYVETLFGRRRYLPDINAKNATVRSLAERNAVNAPIQGTSADIIKMAMIEVDKEITGCGLKSRMVLQIHDELVFDAVPEETGALLEIVKEKMENVIKLSVPLTVECNYGKNWLEAH